MTHFVAGLRDVDALELARLGALRCPADVVYDRVGEFRRR